MNIKRVVSAVTAAMVWSCTCLPSLATGTYSTAYAQSESVTYSIDKENSSQKGTDDNGFTHDVFFELDPKTELDPHGSMTVGSDGTLAVEWDAVVPSTWFEADYGYEYASGTPVMKQGKISIDYKAEHSAGESGNSRIGVHGWLTDPVVEFYVIDNWINWCPSDTNCATVVIDGGEYEMFKLVHSFGGMAAYEPFVQYFSVRKQPRTSGTITVSEHFKAWETLGWKMGNLYSVNFNVSGWESTGSAEIKSLKFNVEKPVTTTAATTATETTTSVSTAATETTTSSEASSATTPAETATTSQETSTTTIPAETSTTSQETSAATALTTTFSVPDDGKKYVEVVNYDNYGRGELIPPYIYYSYTKNGHMYAAEDGCFAASSDSSETSHFSAGINKTDVCEHYIRNNPVTIDYKFENTYDDNYQIAYKLNGINRDTGKNTEIIIVENSKNYQLYNNLDSVGSVGRIPRFPEIELIKTYTSNGHEYELYKDEFVFTGDIMSNDFEKYFAVRKDPEEGPVLEGSIDFNEHLKQIDPNLADHLAVSSLFCVVDADQSTGTIKALKNDIVFDTNDVPFEIKGDFNFDKVIDSLDLVWAKKLLIDRNDVHYAGFYMDLNMDDEFTVADAVMLQSYLLGKITSFDKYTDN